MNKTRHKRKLDCFEEMQRYVAGIDLAGHADHYVCGPRKDDGTHDIEHFGTTTEELRRMLSWLKERGVVSAAMESTSVYWIPVYDILESSGIKVVLVDTRTVRMVPGRKSDVKDCQWLQRLHSAGLLRGAFRPPERFNAIRMVIRERENVIAMRTQAIQSIQKSLDQMNVRLHHAVSDIDGVTGMKMLTAIVNGERDPFKLAAMRDYRCRKDVAAIAAELVGNWRDEHVFNLEQAYLMLVALDERLAAYDQKIVAMFADVSKDSGGEAVDVDKSAGESKRKGSIGERKMLARLMGFDMTSVTGIGIQSAYAIAAELGNDLSMFPDENHFVSYIGLAPPLGTSAGKRVRTGHKAKNTNRVGMILRQCAMGTMRTNSEIGARFRCIRSRSSTLTAVKATARRMAQLLYRGVKFGTKYVEEGEDAYEKRRRDRTIRSMSRKMKSLGISFEELAKAS